MLAGKYDEHGWLPKKDPKEFDYEDWSFVLEVLNHKDTKANLSSDDKLAEQRGQHGFLCLWSQFGASRSLESLITQALAFHGAPNSQKLHHPTTRGVQLAISAATSRTTL
jgi:hypothetical protein